MEKRPRGEDEKRFNATIVVVTTSCGIARSGKKSKRNFVPPWEKTQPSPLLPIRTGHGDGTPGPLDSREGGGEGGTSPQDLDSRGECKVGQEMRGTGELQVKIFWENAVLPVHGSARAAGYDLCAAGSCVIPSQGKGTVETG